MKKRDSEIKSPSDIAWSGTFYIVATLFALVCLFPFLLVIISSFTDEAALVRDGYSLLPQKWSLGAYRALFASETIPNAYYVTTFITVVGTVLSMAVTVAGAYSLASSKMKYRNGLALFFYFTMLFGGGMVPSYILISRYLHLRDSLWVYILPALMNPWNMFLMRNFLKEIPESLKESASIEGANELVVLARVVLPLSLPGIATISLFYALGFWNTWVESMLYIDNEKLKTLQYIIMEIIRNIDAATHIASEGGKSIGGNVVPPSYTIRLATSLVTIGPIILLYPFLQRYFVSGLRVGGVKG